VKVGQVGEPVAGIVEGVDTKGIEGFFFDCPCFEFMERGIEGKEGDGTDAGSTGVRISANL